MITGGENMIWPRPKTSLIRNEIFENDSTDEFSIGFVPYNTIAHNANKEVKIAMKNETQRNVFNSTPKNVILLRSMVARRRADVAELANESFGVTKKGEVRCVKKYNPIAL